MMTEWYWVEDGKYLGIKTQQYGDEPAVTRVQFTGPSGAIWEGSCAELIAILEARAQ